MLPMENDDAIRVLVVDDHAVVRDGLEAFLSVHEDIELIGKVGCGEDALRFCSETQADVVLMDLVLPGINGIKTMRTLRERHPATEIVVLTSFGDLGRANAALGAGARGFLLKDASGDEVAEAVRKAHEGEIVLASSVTKMLVDSLTEATKPKSYDLTWREQEVLRLLAKGLSNPAIAARLDIKTSTVKTHVGHIFSKLGVSSRVEAATFAVEHHLVS